MVLPFGKALTVNKMLAICAAIRNTLKKVMSLCSYTNNFLCQKRKKFSHRFGEDTNDFILQCLDLYTKFNGLFDDFIASVIKFIVLNISIFGHQQKKKKRSHIQLVFYKLIYFSVLFRLF